MPRYELVNVQPIQFRVIPDPPPGFENIGTFVCYSEIFPSGDLVPMENLRKKLRGADILTTFGHLSEVAAILANDGFETDGAVAVTKGALLAVKSETSPEAHQIVDFFENIANGRPIAHEKNIYLLQCLTLAEGARNGRVMTATDLALCMLVANDHIRDPKSEGGDSLESALANLTHHTRFNKGSDTLRDLVRMSVFATPPPQGPLSEAEAFLTLQKKAYGMPFSEYVDTLLGPLSMQSTIWGRPEAGGNAHPIISPDAWVAGTRIPSAAARKLLLEMSISPEVDFPQFG